MKPRIAFFAALLTLGSASGALAAGLEGLWLTSGGKAKVQIAPCDGKLCGTIVWLKQPLNSAGKPVRDSRNEIAELRDRPVVGIPILIGLGPEQADSWVGTVYDPERGQSFDVTVTLAGDSELEVTGCALGGLVCQTKVWTRASDQASSQ